MSERNPLHNIGSVPVVRVTCDCQAIPGPHGTTHKRYCAVIVDFDKRFDLARLVLIGES